MKVRVLVHAATAHPHTLRGDTVPTTSPEDGTLRRELGGCETCADHDVERLGGLFII